MINQTFPFLQLHFLMVAIDDGHNYNAKLKKWNQIIHSCLSTMHIEKLHPYHVRQTDAESRFQNTCPPKCFSKIVAHGELLMSAVPEQGCLFLSLTVLLVFALLVAAPHSLAQEAEKAAGRSFTGAIAGTCFHDNNQNGVLDNGEGGIAGITLSLQRINLLRYRAEIDTTVSDEEGRYEFVGLRGGFYLVEVHGTAQWECSTRNPQAVLVSPFMNEKAYNAAFRKPIVQDSFVFREFQHNSMDTHMYWDGTHLWIPETEYLNNNSKYSTNLIRLNPDDFSYTRFILPPIEYNGETANTIVYEVVPSPGNSDILYISAPYGQPKSIYIFNRTTESADGFRLINGERVYGGNNGARMAVTDSGGNDTVWITCNDSKIATFNSAAHSMTELYDFSSIAPNGLYGIAAVPTGTSGIYTLHVASFSGKLLVFPSSLVSVSQSMTIVVADYGVRDACLTALTYDSEYIWVAGLGQYAGTTKLFIMRYVPATRYDVAGECAFYWSPVGEGIVPAIISYGNWVFAVVENEDECAACSVIRLNKTTGVVDTIAIQFQNPRVAASIGRDDSGNIYVGGYGCGSEIVRPLELVRFKADGG